ncbi:hypothetical protein [Roseateles flavus]|uniref:Glycoside hydrolase family 5 domain-containing protein n=1 Tax=Roseateles flavus TaxID=3149041 RepID=A0ABV0GAS0_9BURK
MRASSMLRRLSLLLTLALSGAQPAVGDDVFRGVTGDVKPAISPDFFGIHIHRLAGTPIGEPGVTPWPNLPFGHIRFWDAGVAWLDLNAVQGHWDFRRMDVYVDTAERRQADILYPLALTPAWASRRPAEPCPYGHGCAAEPADLQWWRDYVSAVARRYGSRIKAFELWNEPNFSNIARDRGRPGFYTGSVEHMVEMARIAREVLDELNPSALLCTPGFVNGPDRLELFLAAGGRRYVQAVCYHFYAENVRFMARELKAVRSIMARQGVGTLPLWNTETGVELLRPGDPPSGLASASTEEVAARAAQLLIFGAAAGLDRFYYYAWDNERSGVFNADRSGRPLWRALVGAQEWLIGTEPGSCQDLAVFGTDIVACRGSRGGESFLWVWSDGPKAVAMSIETILRKAGVKAGTRVKSVQALLDGEARPSPQEVAAGTLRIGRVPVRLAWVAP